MRPVKSARRRSKRGHRVLSPQEGPTFPKANTATERAEDGRTVDGRAVVMCYFPDRIRSNTYVKIPGIRSLSVVAAPSPAWEAPVILVPMMVVCPPLAGKFLAIPALTAAVALSPAGKFLTIHASTAVGALASSGEYEAALASVLEATLPPLYRRFSCPRSALKSKWSPPFYGRKIHPFREVIG